ncbi:hypothetical protein [Paenibacillus chungangensis]|uniref:Uncharacterized protein n=1 Tax=Paenibacillus chungangensis TaxID=696535 RepID=A0ABW3HT66_9BACL
MNLYYSMIGRLLDGRSSIPNEGYYIYRVFPDIRELDEQFNEEMNRNRLLSVADSNEYWSDAIDSDYS